MYIASEIHKDLLNPDYREWFDFLTVSEQWDAEKTAAYQLSQLQAMLQHAYLNTEGYRRLYDRAGIDLGRVNSLEDLRALPCIDKETIRDDLAGFSVTGGTEPREYVTTGGSTGIPFGFYRTGRTFARELASKAYQYHRIGWREGDRQLVLRGIPLETPDRTEYLPGLNELRCSSYHLTPGSMACYLAKAWQYRPDWLRCYPSAGYLFARYLKESGCQFPPLKGVLCASENLYDFQKKLMREVFGARVFSHYGHFELAALAGFCEHEDSYHVLPQYGYVELLDQQQRPVSAPGEVGEIVATSFLMDQTPFIRYRTRDFAVLRGIGCPSCGRPYQIWDRVEGRAQDFVVTAAGRLVSMTAINMHDDIFDHLRQFQFYQERAGEVTLRYLPKATLSEGQKNEIVRRLKVKLGDDMKLELEEVAEIPLTPRGKYRFLQQKLNLGAGDAWG